MKKKFYTKVFAAVTAAALCMSGCGSAQETTVEETTTEAAESTVEETSAEATESTETTVEESVEPELTFAEENGLEYSEERSFTVSGTVVFVDENDDLTEYEGLSIANYEDTFAFGDATVSEPDDDGYVTITVSASTNIPFDVLCDASVSDGTGWRYGWGFSSPALFDTYTGLAFESETHNDASVSAATDISYDGVTYTVTVAKDVEWNSTYSDWVQDTDTVYRSAYVVEVQETWTITAPQDYDGLCFAFCSPHEYEYSSTEDNAASIEQTLEESLAEDGYTLDDVAAYVSVSDLLGE